MVSGLAMPVETVAGACGKGPGDRAVDLQIGVVGVESVSIPMSVDGVEASLPGGGIVRSRIVTFFFFRFSFDMLRGDSLVAFGVWTARLSVLDSSSSSLVV